MLYFLFNMKADGSDKGGWIDKGGWCERGGMRSDKAGNEVGRAWER